MNTRLYLKIPKERVAVLIGKHGKIKKKIERLTQTIIKVNSSEGSVIVIPSKEMLDPVAPLKAKSIIQAIGRGFNPEKAMKLIEDDYVLEIIDINEYARGSRNSLIRLKGRVIGEEGKARRMIEELTDTDVCIYGHTVGIIGKIEDVMAAKKAVTMLLEGAKHGTVLRYLQKYKREKKMSVLRGWRVF
ncbi:MAG: KH domain-containing protein [Candidatus Asgardarchaeia archaeon]